MRVEVSVCGHERFAVSLNDAVCVYGAVSVVMRSRLDVGRRVDVMRVYVSECRRQRCRPCVLNGFL